MVTEKTERRFPLPHKEGRRGALPAVPVPQQVTGEGAQAQEGLQSRIHVASVAYVGEPGQHTGVDNMSYNCIYFVFSVFILYIF